MNNRDVFRAVVERLKAEAFLNGFKLRRRDFTFFRQEGDLRRSIELEHWNKDGCLVIYPIYMIRFEVLLKWFEPYSFKSLQDQRDNPSVAFSGDMLGRQNVLTITATDFERDYLTLRDTLDECSDTVFSSYTSLRDMFDREISPVLEGKRALPDVGADWVFKYLALTRMVSPKDYRTVKDLVLLQVQKMVDRHEPNVIEYVPRFDEIINAMEQQEL